MFIVLINPPPQALRQVQQDDDKLHFSDRREYAYIVGIVLFAKNYPIRLIIHDLVGDVGDGIVVPWPFSLQYR